MAKGSILLGCLILCSLVGFAVSWRATIYNVLSFGAVGDGTTDDSKNFLRAWKAACYNPHSPTVLIPWSRSFLLTETNFTGPCASNMHVQIDGEIVAPRVPWLEPSTKWIRFANVSDLVIDGNGTIDGRGFIWWDCFNRGMQRCIKRPDAVGLSRCNNSRVSGVTFVNAQKKHLTISNSTNVVIDGISVYAPSYSNNTDGIHVQVSRNVLVTNCIIASGDDCIAVGRSSLNVTILNMTCGPGHGISIGSLGMNNSRDTVEHVRVANSILTNTTNGLRIKTWQGGSGYVKGITFENIHLHNVKNPIYIDQYYCPHMVCQNQTSAVEISDVRFRRIKGTASDVFAVRLACSETVACKNINLQDVIIRAENTTAGVVNYCLNAWGNTTGLVVPPVTCLR